MIDRTIARYLFCVSVALLFLGVSRLAAQAPVCHDLTAGNLSYSQDFDSLAMTGTSSTIPGGFGFIEAGTNANTTYAAGNGGSSTGNTYSYGTDGSSERAFGGLQSSSLIPTVGACFRNLTGSTVTAFQIEYDGEQWRLGNLGRLDKLDFQFSTDATSLTTGTWMDFDGLDFIAPNSTTAGGILDGNAAGNRTADITATISSLTIANGASFYIRYNSFDALNSDDGLAVDNFSLTATLGATAADASIGGRVATANGRGIANVRVIVTGGDLSQPLTAITSPFGYYRIEGLRAGQTYIVNVGSKRYTFETPVRAVSLGDDALDVNFIGEQN